MGWFGEKRQIYNIYIYIIEDKLASCSACMHAHSSSIKSTRGI